MLLGLLRWYHTELFGNQIFFAAHLIWAGPFSYVYLTYERTAVQETASYRWAPQHRSYWTLHFSAFRPRVSFAQQIVPFCLNTFVNLLGQISHLVRFLQNPSLCGVKHDKQEQDSFIPKMKYNQNVVYFVCDAFSAGTRNLIMLGPTLSKQEKPSSLQQITRSDTQKHAVFMLSANLRRDCRMWFHNCEMMRSEPSRSLPSLKGERGLYTPKCLRLTPSNHTNRTTRTKNRHSSGLDIGCEWHFHFQGIGRLLWNCGFVTEASKLEL